MVKCLVGSTSSMTICSMTLRIGSTALGKIDGSIRKLSMELNLRELPNRRRRTYPIRSLKAPTVLPSTIPDVGEGYYEPVKSIIYEFNGKILRTPSEKEV